MEPYRLRRWKSKSSSQRADFFTCARPGRSRGKKGSIEDALVHKWVHGIPGDTRTVVVSLLGRKPDDESEFSYYSFYGMWDQPTERGGGLSFQQWLDHYHKDRSIQVVEFPTHDFKPISAETLNAIASEISRLLSEGRTVVVVDSGGETRTKAVCKHMGFVEDTRTG